MRSKLTKAWRLTRAEWAVLVEAVLLLLIVRAGTRLWPIKRLVALMEAGKLLRGLSPAGPRIAPERIAYLVEVASRHHFPRPTCLMKALVVYRLLRKQGLAVKLILGATKSTGKLEAHIWLEHQGRVLFGGPVEKYVPLRFPDGGQDLAQAIHRAN